MCRIFRLGLGTANCTGLEKSQTGVEIAQARYGRVCLTNAAYSPVVSSEQLHPLHL